MIVLDQFGYRLPAEAACIVGEWNACVTAFLAHGATTPARLDAVLSGAPGFSMAWAAKGFFLTLLARRELVEGMRDAHAAAFACAADARESAYADALGFALSGRFGKAADRLDALLVLRPRDALAMKLVHALRFMIGDAAGMRRSVEAVLPTYADGHPHAGFVRGCHAFALEETGDYAAAERTGHSALDLRPDDAWGLHAVLHVYEMTARAADGARWVERRHAAFAHCNNFAFHIHWHVALFRLDGGDRDGALHQYDEHVRPESTDDFRDVANASSLLARLEIEGVDVAARWEELAEIATRRKDDACNIFADLHYLMALVRAGRSTDARWLAARIAEDARADTGDLGRAARRAGRSAAEGLCALGSGEYRLVFHRLADAALSLEILGGSHAQRDVFHWLAIDAALRAGRVEESTRLLILRCERRTGRDGFTLRRLRDIAAARSALVAG